MSASVCLAISSFRNDQAVADLLDVAAPLIPSVFSQVIVVDSLGSGDITRLIEERGWKKIRYESAQANLGSAGNLARRLQLAAETDADFVYALNHDGKLAAPTVAALVRAAEQVKGIGAAYPLRILKNRGRGYDITGASRYLLPRRTMTTRPDAATLRAYWGSSNGALYALEPVRRGLLPRSDFWMGWEDLDYGWLLDSRGYSQIIVCDAVFEDPYEFRQLGVAGSRAYITEKPTWYAYYMGRNLLMIRGRVGGEWVRGASLAARIAIEVGVTALFRSKKRERLRLLARGIKDAFRGVSGKQI